ncbi:MAG: copper homeostasis protein CutC [Blastocatellales bacterium]
MSKLEVIACSFEDAVAAERGGADRLEVISRYEAGGLTPPVEMVRQIAATVKIPLRIMLRETEPFVINEASEIERLCEAARAFAEIGVEGLVLGFLKDGKTGKSIDHDLVARILACAPHLKATFHRAFEELNDPFQAIEELKRHRQIDRILTSGGEDSWRGKVDRFAAWQCAAQPEVEILVGGGTDAEVISLLKPVGIKEFHVGKAAREGQRIDGMVQAEQVSELSELIRA